MIPVPKNKLQEQFEFEKSQLEKHGHISSLTHEEWLELKVYSSENNKPKKAMEE